MGDGRWRVGRFPGVKNEGGFAGADRFVLTRARRGLGGFVSYFSQSIYRYDI